jgi:hypothetical protein
LYCTAGYRWFLFDLLPEFLSSSGNSNIEAYEITDTSIHVRFRSGAQRNYLYDSAKPGMSVVNVMKGLAAQGQGLNSYISTTVKGNFSRKW